jgi:nitrite reductase/ring-hydroxylating ferredoxin subunit
MKRKKFIGAVCPAIVVVMFAAPFLVSCSKDEKILEIPMTEEEAAYLELKKQMGDSGFFTDGKKLHIDTSHKDYSKLETVSEFINDLENGLLLLRKDEKNIMAFDNCCPHLGSRNQWSFSNNKFRCNNHGNSFGIETEFTSYCSSNSNSGNLRQYPVIIYEDIITIDFS